MRDKKDTGQRGESLAEAYLRMQGMEILKKNFRCCYGEVDIIAKDGEYLVFVEVKTRKTKHCGYPGEALTILKRKRICQTARFYCFFKDVPEEQPVRFDVVEVLKDRICHRKDAFDFQDEEI